MSNMVMVEAKPSLFQVNSVHNMSHSRGLPGLPPWPTTSDKEPSDLYKVDSVHNMSHSRGLPGLPPWPKASAKEPSDLYKLVLKHSHYPPLMQSTSWTLAAPFKEQRYHRNPSNSIANNYTPTARDLKLSKLSVYLLTYASPCAPFATLSISTLLTSFLLISTSYVTITTVPLLVLPLTSLQAAYVSHLKSF
ncbi:dynein heavy chain 3, axonemal [Pelobates cultripes]|uniref:Dynein heavy chain 3, axonemal n=1 Tax=Pelobates cultripes TaxID=61616 RepID=A0AAD1WDY4_PELCU|nr:dynein heavy chain 3, axonemal [Pelobates cultripes]